MNFKAIAHRFLYLFYVAGMSACNPRANSPVETWKTRMIQFVPTCFYLTVIVAIGIITEYAHLRLQIFPDTMDTLVTHILILSECILNFTVVGQTILVRRNYNKLLHIYVELENYMNVRFGCPVRFEKFQRVIYNVTIVLLIPFVVTWMVRKIIGSFAVNVTAENGLLMSQFVAIIVHLHAIVHVKLLNFYFTFATDGLKSKVAPVSATRTNDTFDLTPTQGHNKGFNQLRQLKFIHFKLWEISMIINRIFGWSIAAMIFRNWVEVAYSAYWIYLYSILDHTYWTLLRKYLLINQILHF